MTVITRGKTALGITWAVELLIINSMLLFSHPLVLSLRTLMS
jgi:hypothetical protein